MEIFIYIIAFLLLCIVTVYGILKSYFKDRKVRNGVMNSDTFMRRYVYALKCGKQDVIDKLSTHSAYDKPEYLFDEEALIITFIHLNAKSKYQLSFIERDNCNYLYVHQIDWLQKSHIPYMINEFWIKKVDAVPVEYSFFEKNVLQYQ